MATWKERKRNGEKGGRGQETEQEIERVRKVRERGGDKQSLL